MPEPTFQVLHYKTVPVAYLGDVAESLGWPEQVKWDEAMVRVRAPVAQTTGYVEQEGEVSLVTLIALISAAMRAEPRLVSDTRAPLLSTDGDDA
jgi:hypothetical protein